MEFESSHRQRFYRFFLLLFALNLNFCFSFLLARTRVPLSLLREKQQIGLDRNLRSRIPEPSGAHADHQHSGRVREGRAPVQMDIIRRGVSVFFFPFDTLTYALLTNALLTNALFFSENFQPDQFDRIHIA